MRHGLPFLALLLLALPAWLPDQDPPAQPRVDLYGDPLPAGAVARLGTMRWRHIDYSGAMSVAVSPDGKIIATGGDKSLRLWETATGRRLRDVQGYQFSALVFSPDGKWVTSKHANQVTLVEVSTGRIHRRFSFDGYALCFSRDSRQLVLATVEGLISVWDTTTAKELWTQHEHESAVHSGALSPDGKTLVTVAHDRRICRWDLAAGKLEKKIELGVPDWRDVRVSADGGTLAIIPERGTCVQLWDTATGQKRLELQGESAGATRSVAFSPDGKTLAGHCFEGYQEVSTIALWDTATGKALRRFTIRGRYADRLHFLPDGKTLVGAGSWPQIALWDTITGRALFPEPGHDSQVNGVDFTADGRTVVSGSSDGLRVWDAATGRQLRWISNHRWGVTSLTVLPQGREVISAGHDGTLRLTELATGTEVRRFVVAEPPEKQTRPVHSVYGMQLTRDGRRVASATAMGPHYTYHLWDVESGQRLVERRIHPEPVIGAFSPDGQSYAVRSETLTAIHEAATGKQLIAFVPEQEKSSAHAFSPDGRLFVTVSFRTLREENRHLREDLTLHFWDLATGSERLRIVRPGPATSHLYHRVVFSRDGRLAATWRSDNTIQIWDTGTGKELMAFSSDDSMVYSMAFSPDSRRLATGHTDSTILLWDVSQTTARVDPAKPADGKQLDAWWNALGDADAKKAHLAIWGLIDHPEQAVPLLQKRLTPVAKLDPKRVKELLARLDSEKFAEREEAAKELGALEELAEPVLQAAMKEDITAEKRRRIEALLARPRVVTNLDNLRRIRAVEVLEHLGTPAAQEVLKTLAQGEAASRATQEAKTALGRMEKRKRNK